MICFDVFINQLTFPSSKWYQLLQFLKKEAFVMKGFWYLFALTLQNVIN